MAGFIHQLFLLWILLQIGQQLTQSCNTEEKNVYEKYRQSPVVLLATFLDLTPNQTDPRVMLVAGFRLERILKHNGHRIGAILKFPLYRGHAMFSKKTWCLNERMLRTGKKYILYVNYSAFQSRGSINQELRTLFLPDAWNRNMSNALRREMLMNEQVQMDSVAELPVLPIYEVELDFDKADQRAKKAEIDTNTGVQLRCTVKGEAHEAPELGWIYAGDILTTNEDGIEVETDNQRLVTNLKLSKKHASKGGTYECTAKRKSDGKFYNSKLKIVPLTTSSNETIFGEVFCGPEREGWCQHGGTCLYQPTTGIYSCRCTSEHTGRNCEYESTELHVITRTSSPVTPPAITDPGQYRQSMILMGSTASIVIVTLILAFLLYVKKRDQIKTRFSSVSFRKRRDENVLLENESRNEADEERLIGKMPSTHQPGDQSTATIPKASSYPRSRDDRIKERLHIIQSLVPARCPHCHHKLGIKADSLNLAPEVSNGSDPQLAIDPKESDRAEFVTLHPKQSINGEMETDQLRIDLDAGKGKEAEYQQYTSSGEGDSIKSSDQKSVADTKEMSMSK